MEKTLHIGDINYFRGTSGSLCFSSQVILNNEHIAFYNSETGEFKVNEENEDCLNLAINEYLKEYKLINDKDGVLKLIEKLGLEKS